MADEHVGFTNTQTVLIDRQPTVEDDKRTVCHRRQSGISDGNPTATLMVIVDISSPLDR